MFSVDKARSWQLNLFFCKLIGPWNLKVWELPMYYLCPLSILCLSPKYTALVCVCCTQSFSRVWLLGTPWTVGHQAPLSMEFSRQEYWNGLPFPSPWDPPDSGIKLESPALQAILYDWATREASIIGLNKCNSCPWSSYGVTSSLLTFSFCALCNDFQISSIKPCLWNTKTCARHSARNTGN